MKTLATVSVLLSALFLSGLSTHKTFAQANSTKEERRAAANAFNAAYDNQWVIRWDDRRGSPRSMFGQRITHYDGTPIQIATAFLGSNKQMFGIQDVSKDMRLVKTNNSMYGGTRLVYEQQYRDIPVLNSGYLIAIDFPDEGKSQEYLPPGTSTPRDPFDPTVPYDQHRDKTDYTQSRDDWYIYFVNGDYYPDIELDVTPSLSASDAEDRARETGRDSDLEDVSNAHLAILADETGDDLAYKLVYKVEGVTQSGASWGAVIDAHTGAMIEHGTKSSGVTDFHEGGMTPQAPDLYPPILDLTTATGDIYKTNPNHSSVSEEEPIGYVYMYNPRKLWSQYVKVVRGDTGSVATGTGTPALFSYAPSNAHFDEVMAYAHSYNFRYWLYDMGMPYNKVPFVTITVRHPSVYATSYPPSTIYYMSGKASYGWLNPTHEAAVITHEFTHLVTDQYYNGFNSGRPEHEHVAMWEGYSDYFGIAWRDEQGCSGAGCNTIGYYADASSGGQPAWKRVVGTSANYSGYWDGQEAGTDHDNNVTLNTYDNSLIFSGALWDFRDDAGWLADYMVLESLNNLGSSIDFLDGKDALYVAAGETYDGNSCSTCPNLVCYNFNGRGITGGSECPAPKRGEGRPQANVAVEILQGYKLFDNFPNPFNPATTISFELPEVAQVSLVIYDILGREVSRLVEEPLEPGRYDVTWEAGHLQSGTYFCLMTAGSFKQVRPLVLLK